MQRKFALGALIVFAGSMWIAGCVVVRPRGVRVAVPIPVPHPVVAVHYSPLHYSGHLVYYTSAGVPFYWNGGVRVYVPVNHRHRYVTHYQKHRRAYHEWQRKQGRHGQQDRSKSKKAEKRQRRKKRG
jgi:hypothetical protein